MEKPGDSTTLTSNWRLLAIFGLHNWNSENYAEPESYTFLIGNTILL
jgi:hypothetical protein